MFMQRLVMASVYIITMLKDLLSSAVCAVVISENGPMPTVNADTVSS